MSITDLISEAEKLEAIDRKRLMSHLVLLRLRENDEYRKELTRRLDDKDPKNWVSLEELEKRLKIK